MDKIFYSFQIGQNSQVQTGFWNKFFFLVFFFFGKVNPKDIKIFEIMSRSAMKSEKR